MLSDDLANNGMLMSTILARQTDVKRVRDKDAHIVKAIQSSMGRQTDILGRLAVEVDRLKEKQSDRKALKKAKQRLWSQGKLLQERLAEREESERKLGCTLRGELSAARCDFEEMKTAMEQRCAQRVAELEERQERNAREAAHLAAACQDALTSAVLADLKASEASLAQRNIDLERSMVDHHDLVSGLNEQHTKELQDVQQAGEEQLCAIRVQCDALMQDKETLAGSVRLNEEQRVAMQQQLDGQADIHREQLAALKSDHVGTVEALEEQLRAANKTIDANKDEVLQLHNNAATTQKALDEERKRALVMETETLQKAMKNAEEMIVMKNRFEAELRACAHKCEEQRARAGSSEASAASERSRHEDVERKMRVSNRLLNTHKRNTHVACALIVPPACYFHRMSSTSQ